MEGIFDMRSQTSVPYHVLTKDVFILKLFSESQSVCPECSVC